MNLRTSSLAEEIIDGLSIIDIKEESLILVYLPPNLDTITTRTIGESITRALCALDKHNTILLLPKDITIAQLDEPSMKEHGWIRDDRTTKPTERNPIDSRLCEHRKGNEVTTDLSKPHKISPEEPTHFINSRHWIGLPR